MTDTTPLSDDTRERLRHVSVATLCTQLFKRGFRNVYLQQVRRLTTPSSGNLVGPAFTMRNIPAREDIDHIGVYDDPDHSQRRAIEVAPQGSVLVIDCREDARSASAGGILVRRLEVRGVAGLVTIEDNVVMGGAGSGVAELLATEGVTLPMLHLGLPDAYQEHASREDLLAEAGIDATGIEAAVLRRWPGLRAAPAKVV